MKNSIVLGVFAALAVSAAAGAWAGGQKGGKQAGGQQQMQRQHQMDQDRDRDREHQPDKAWQQDRERDRDRAHQDLDPIYGNELMSEQERLTYREQLRARQTGEEREQFRAEHRNKMQLRAQEQGVNIAEPVYGQNMMTQEEQLRYREQLQDMQTEQERERFEARHRAEMQLRAQKQTLQPEEEEAE